MIFWFIRSTEQIGDNIFFFSLLISCWSSR